MANKKITELQLIDAVTGSLNIPGDNAIQSYRFTALQMLTYILTRTNMLAGAVAKFNVASKTAGYDLLSASDDVILADATSGGFTLGLPASSGLTGRVFIIKKIDSSANVVTIDANSTETIDGETTLTLYNQFESVRIMSDGTNWVVI